MMEIAVLIFAGIWSYFFIQWFVKNAREEHEKEGQKKELYDRFNPK